MRKMSEPASAIDAPRAFGESEARGLLKHPSADANKYSRGVCVVVAGSENYPGAAVLCASAAPRCGAGYTRLLTPASAAQVARCHLISVPVTACSEEDGGFAPTAADEALAACKKATALVVGPGLGTAPQTESFLWRLLEAEQLKDIPILFDADALNIIARDRCRFLEARGGCSNVLTPHEGEAARLLDRKVTERLDDARELGRTWASAVVLKGPKTLIAQEGEVARVCTNAGPELAKAGSGDVLAGMLGSLLSQGLDTISAACLAVYLHGEAGKAALLKQSDISVVPEDLIGAIGVAVQRLEA